MSHVVNTLVADLRYALRAIRRAPSFFAVAVLSLALGMGANLTVFSIADGLLLRPLPVASPKEIVAVSEAPRSGGYAPVSLPDLLDYRASSHALTELTAYELANVGVGSGAHSELVAAMLVDGWYFRTLGVRTAHGRPIGPQDDAAGAANPVAVISERWWRQRLGGDTAVIGRSIVVNGTPLTIIGIAPAAFAPVLGLSIDVYAPLAMRPQLVPTDGALTDRDFTALSVFGRLRPGVRVEDAQRELGVIAHRIDEGAPRRSGPRRIVLARAGLLAPGARAPVTVVALLLLAVTGLVLILACTNLVNLLMARATARRREFAIRAALGASRSRIVRQLVLEGLIVSTAGAAVALWLANVAGRALLTLLPPTPVPLVVHVDARGHSLVAVAVIAIGSALAISLVPALRLSKDSLSAALRDTTSGAGYSIQTITQRRRAVVIQVGLTSVLLVLAGLFVRSLRQAEDIDPGFHVGRILLAGVDLGPRFPDPALGLAGYDRLISSLEQTSGVSGVALTDRLPLDGGEQATRFQVEHEAAGAADYSVVNGAYFKIMGIDLIAGRTFSTAAHPAPEAIVNATLAQRYFTDGKAIGKRIRVNGADGPWMEVVGIARDGKYRSLNEAPQAFVYLPFRDHYRSAMTLVIGARVNPQRLVPGVRSALAALDPNVPLFETRTLRQHMSVSLLPARIAGALFGALGLLTLFLAALGVHGVVSFGTQLRRTEMGVRLALGAQPGDVVRLVVAQAMRPVAIGLGAGLAAALLVCRVAARFLYGITAADPPTYVAVIGVVAVTALVSCLLPARRIARTHPTNSLRAD